MEEKDILIQGYWVNVIKEFQHLSKLASNEEDMSAKLMRGSLLTMVEALNKIIELEEE